LRFFMSVSFSRFSAHPAVSRASQLVYLITFPKKSQQPFLSFFTFFAFFLVYRTIFPKGFLTVLLLGRTFNPDCPQNCSSFRQHLLRENPPHSLDILFLFVYNENIRSAFAVEST